MAEARAITGQDIDDLAALVRVLQDNPNFVRALTDSSMPLAARSGLVDQALAATGQTARDGLKAIVADGVASATGLLRRVHDYLMRTAWTWADQAGQLLEVTDQVFGFSRGLTTNRELRWALVDRQADLGGRLKLAQQVTAGLLPAASALIQACVAASDGTLDARLRRCVDLGVAQSGARLATVTVARSLDDQQRQRLAAALARRFGTPVVLEEVVDPAVVGGVRVECGADVVDSTILSRLEAARRAIA